MLEFHDRIPDITGRTCVALLVEWYSHRGGSPSPIAVVLNTDDGKWHRFFIDSGTVFWRVTLKQPSIAPNDADYHYTVADAGDAAGLHGDSISSVGTIDLPKGGEIRIRFAEGASAVFRGLDNVTDFHVQTPVPPFA